MAKKFHLFCFITQLLKTIEQNFEFLYDTVDTCLRLHFFPIFSTFHQHSQFGENSTTNTLIYSFYSPLFLIQDSKKIRGCLVCQNSKYFNLQKKTLALVKVFDEAIPSSNVEVPSETKAFICDPQVVMLAFILLLTLCLLYR